MSGHRTGGKKHNQHRPALTMVKQEITRSPIVNQILYVPRSHFNYKDALCEIKESKVKYTIYEWVEKKLLEWSLRNSSIVFFDFLDEYSIPEATFYQACERLEELKEAHNVAMQRIGSRRFKLSMFKLAECNERTINNTLRLYSKDHRQIYEEDVKFKQSNIFEADKKVTIVLNELKETK